MSLPGLTLFLGVALSITAIPVLGRIMMELAITRTRLGAITITAAAVDDAIGWILLASVAAVVRSNFDPLETLRMVGLTVGFALACSWFAVRPVLVRYFTSLAAGQRRRARARPALAVLLVVAVAVGRRDEPDRHLRGVRGVPARGGAVRSGGTAAGGSREAARHGDRLLRPGVLHLHRAADGHQRHSHGAARCG